VDSAIKGIQEHRVRNDPLPQNVHVGRRPSQSLKRAYALTAHALKPVQQRLKICQYTAASKYEALQLKFLVFGQWRRTAGDHLIRCAEHGVKAADFARDVPKILRGPSAGLPSVQCQLRDGDHIANPDAER
jgi:glycerol-3-phosphate dehydrogenase